MLIALHFVTKLSRQMVTPQPNKSHSIQTDVVFVACFPSNRRFLTKSSHITVADPDLRVGGGGGASGFILVEKKGGGAGPPRPPPPPDPPLYIPDTVLFFSDLIKTEPG